MGGPSTDDGMVLPCRVPPRRPRDADEMGLGGSGEGERERARAEREKFIDNEVTEEQVTEEEMTQVTEAEFTTRVYYTTTVHHSGTTPSPGHRRASPISGRGSVQQS